MVRKIVFGIYVHGNLSFLWKAIKPFWMALAATISNPSVFNSIVIYVRSGKVTVVRWCDKSEEEVVRKTNKLVVLNT